ncbi:MAG TPA: hypothetical protein VN876_08755, partial [Gemmatimonadaceae bacterium]|nr:hypothetical protein [Gemmatimonadaceae bacterium]
IEFPLMPDAVARRPSARLQHSVVQTWQRRWSRQCIQQFDLDVHTYKGDANLRCFHVRLADLDYRKLPNLWIRVVASSGSQLVWVSGVWQ